VNEYKQESENAELSKTAGELLENAGDPKFANSKVITLIDFKLISMYSSSVLSNVETPSVMLWLSLMIPERIIGCSLVTCYGQSGYRPQKCHKLQPNAIQILET